MPEEVSKFVRRDSDWEIIDPVNWKNRELWKKVINKNEFQRYEVDQETDEQFVYVLKNQFRGNIKTGSVINKLHYDQEIMGLVQKKWFFSNATKLKAKVVYCYDSNERITNEIWFDGNNLPNQEIAHKYKDGGEMETESINL